VKEARAAKGLEPDITFLFIEDLGSTGSQLLQLL
jgi:hypothetical protein